MRRFVPASNELPSGLSRRRGSSAGAGVASMDGCLQGMSSMYDESLSGCGSSPESRVYLQWFQ